jgi:Rieske Fe-S protein
MSKPSNSVTISGRRSFLGKIAGLIAAFVAGVVGVTTGKYALYPAFRKTSEEKNWQVVCPLEDIPENEPVKRSVVISQDAGWGRFNSQRLIWILREGSGLVVFSATCPHLGCTVNAASNGFMCPCHGSAWTRDGQRLGGPTLRGLDTLDYRIEEGVLKVKYEFFKQSIAEKEAIS